MNDIQQQISDIQHIKKMMENSSRFISLSGKSGIASGLCALIGALFANFFINAYYKNYDVDYVSPNSLLIKLIIVAIVTFLGALVTAFFFTYIKSKKQNVSLFGIGSKRLAWNTIFPMIIGGFVILIFIFNKDYYYVAPTSLIFYGLGLVNGSKYTLGEVKYLGYVNIILGMINFILPNQSLLLWALGFGVAHIAYGIAMWFKYDRIQK